MDSQSNTIPSFLKKKQKKLGGEENDKLLELNNDINKNDINAENTAEKVKFLFPNLSQKYVTQIVERANNNIDEAIKLIKELNHEQNQKNEEKNFFQRKNKIVKKRNYLQMHQNNNQNIIQEQNQKNDIIINNKINIFQSKDDKNNNDKEINININNNINKEEKIDPSITQKQHEIKSNDNHLEKNKIKEDNSNNNERDNDTNNLLNSLDGEKKKLINDQIDYLLNRFSKMKDISELKNLLKEIGFPENKESIEQENKNKIKLKKDLDEKVKRNQEKKNAIINLYNRYTKITDDITKKEELLEELTNTLGNLIEIEAEQKIRKQRYENEVREYENSREDYDYFNGPKEGC